MKLTSSEEWEAMYDATTHRVSAEAALEIQRNALLAAADLAENSNVVQPLSKSGRILERERLGRLIAKQEILNLLSKLTTVK